MMTNVQIFLWFSTNTSSYSDCWLLLTDRVFGPDCQTQRVYEEGAKDVALSALTGLNCKFPL